MKNTDDARKGIADIFTFWVRLRAEVKRSTLRRVWTIYTLLKQRKGRPIQR